MHRLRNVLILSLILFMAVFAGCTKPGSVNIEKTTNGIDADTAPGPEIFVGEAVTWRYTVTNTGSTDLDTVSVTDNMTAQPFFVGGDTNGDDVLQPGETWVFEIQGVAAAGQYENIGKVRAYDKGKLVEDEDYSHYSGVVRRPGITITKKTNDVDANSEPGPSILAGGEVTWTYKVENTGDVDLTDIAVSDDRGLVPVKVAGDSSDAVLAPGEVWIFEAEGTATLGQYSNIGTVEAYSGLIKVSDTDPSHYLGVEGPDIDIEKSTNGEDADSAPGPAIPVGDAVTWTYRIENTGDVDLTDVLVEDDKVADPSYDSGDDGDGVLEPGEVWFFEATGVASLGQYSNTGSVSAKFAAEDMAVSDTDMSHYIGVAAPAVDIQKYTNGEDADAEVDSYQAAVGEAITWTYEVENAGGVDLTGVVVTDDQGEVPAYVGGDDGDGVLEPGETWVYEATGIAEAGLYSNIGTVEAWYNSTKVTDSDPSHYYAEEEPVPAVWEYDFMVAGNGDKIGDEGWLVDAGDIGEYGQGFWLNQATICPPIFFTGDFTAEFYFYPRVLTDDYIFRMAFRLWNNQYATSSARRYVELEMEYFGDPTHESASHSLNQGNNPYTPFEDSGNAPGLAKNDINVCVMQKVGSQVTVHLNGHYVGTVNILSTNLASGYAPMVHGHGSWEQSESNLFLRKIKVMYTSGETFYDSW